MQKNNKLTQIQTIKNNTKMRKKLKTAMTVIIAIQSAIEIAKFVGESYKSYKMKKQAKSEEDAAEPQTTNANDQVRED